MNQGPVAATILSMEFSRAHALASRTNLDHRNRFGDASGAELVQSGLTGVEMAVLEDHLDDPLMPAGAPPYAWAHHRLTRAQRRRGERSS